MKFEDIDKTQKAKALPKYVICGIDPEDNRLVFFIPLFETKEEAQKALSESDLPKHYNVVSQDEMAKLVFNSWTLGDK